MAAILMMIPRWRFFVTSMAQSLHALLSSTGVFSIHILFDVKGSESPASTSSSSLVEWDFTTE